MSGTNMGLYRSFIAVYYSKKNFMYLAFMLCALMSVYMYLSIKMTTKTGTHWLNPRINKEVVKPHVPYQENSDLGEQQIKDFDSIKLIKITDFITERYKCPACFGTDLCKEIDSGEIKIIEPEDGDVLKLKGVYNGYWGKKPVVIKRLNKEEEYARVDAFICQNASMPANCDVSEAILHKSGVVQLEKAFHPDFLREGWRIMHQRRDQLPVAACITDDAIKVLSEEFDTNKDGTLNGEEKSMFFLSLVLNPESLFLEFAKKQGLKIHFPEVLGRCGRVVVTEHAGLPLSSFLDKPFRERADIAMMLLGMIFFLQNFSTKFSMVYSDFNFDNFYVRDYNLYIVDAEDMIVSDTGMYPEPKGNNEKLCNAECFETFSQRLFDYDNVPRSEVCPLSPAVTEEAMYALACERILSYLPEHRLNSPFRGLLHDPPEEIESFLTSALRECVTETTAEGRISSIDVLSEMLEKYTDYGNYMYHDDDDYPGIGDDKEKQQQEPQQL